MMSKIARKYCLISTLYIWQGYLTFSYYFIFDRILFVLVTFYQWGHFAMLVITNLNLISVQSWTYLGDNDNDRVWRIFWYKTAKDDANDLLEIYLCVTWKCFDICQLRLFERIITQCHKNALNSFKAKKTEQKLTFFTVF